MPQPLTELETQIVQRLLARVSFAMQIYHGDFDAWDTPVPLNPEPPLPSEIDHLHYPSSLAEAGAHHLAIAQFRELLLQDEVPDSALHIAISALLWGERDVAEEWALRSLQKMEAEIASQIDALSEYGREVKILKLAKVFRALGRAEEEKSLRKHLNALLPDLKTGRDPGMEAVRLSVELGYELEAEALALKLPPLIVGHSRGYLTRRLFRTLLAHNKQILAWSLFAMTTEPHDEDSLRYAAIEAACEMENFELAVKFSTKDGHEKTKEWPHLIAIANWLIAQRRTHDWKGIWEMISEDRFGFSHRFSSENQLKFLATLVEHVSPADRVAMFKISNDYCRGWATSPNRESAQRITNIHLVIAIWGGSKAIVRKLVNEAKLPRHNVPTAIRAAADRDLPFLLGLIPQAQSTFLIPDTTTALEFEWERMQRGKRHRLEKVLQASLHQALVTNDQGMLHRIISFVGRTWKDLDRYRELLAKYPSPIGLSIVDLGPFIGSHVNAGNLTELDNELSKIDSALCLSEASDEIYRCLKHRFGLHQQLEDF